MKRKQKVDLTIAFLLIAIGIVLLACPLLKINNIKWSFITIMGLYSILNTIQFILTFKDKDFEGLFTAIASIVVLVVSLFFKVGTTPLSLAISLMLWIIFMALIKLKKTDYYDDRKDKMWKLRVYTLAIFVAIGLLTCINLYYDSEVQTLVIGYFFFIHGVLELMDPVVNYLIIKK